MASSLRQVMIAQVRHVSLHDPLVRFCAGRFLPKESEVVLSAEAPRMAKTRMLFSAAPRGLSSGAATAVRNVFVGTVVGPLFALSGSIEGLLNNGPVGLVLGTAEGVCWGSIFSLLGCYTAAMQLVRGSVNTVTSPVHRFVLRRQWDPLEATWKHPSAEPDPYLRAQPSDEELWSAAMERMAQRARRTADNEPSGAYKRLSLHLHPDRNKAPDAHEQFDELAKAYSTLKDPEKRKRYDAGGKKALDNEAGMSKRDGLRGVFGGDAVLDLVGDTQRGRALRRMIDEVQYDTEECWALNLRQRERCALTLLQYLKDYPSEGKDDAWADGVRRKIHGFINVGLAKEVLFAVGTVYKTVLAGLDQAAPARVAVGITSAPHHAYRKVHPYLRLASVSSATRSSKSFVMDTCWATGVMEIEANAHWAATAVVADPALDPQTAAHRRKALTALAGVFINAGRPYSGASDAVLEKLRQSVVNYARQGKGKGKK